MCLVADIGGTNARFALFENGRLESFQDYACAAFDSIESVLSTYIDSLSGYKPKQAVIAIATHVSGDEVEFTNLSWSFSIRKIAKQWGFQRTKFVNDFTAASVAVPHLNYEQLIALGGKPSPNRAAKVVIGAGTGLGISGLLPSEDGWVPVQGQGGHVSYAPKGTYQRDIFDYLFRQNEYVSAEDLLSGRGLVTLYRAVSAVNDTKTNDYTPADVMQHGLDLSDAYCRDVLDTFAYVLSDVSSNLVLTMGARGGLFICGGVINHMIDYFKEDNDFRKNFENKGRMSSYIEEIPAYIIADTKVGLLGALECTKSSYDFIGINHIN